ncbi:MAG TPA: hypothetical protein PKM60_08785 [Zoogloea sp.]|nr:hypothetical protein [Zoogloea sp.]
MRLNTNQDSSPPEQRMVEADFDHCTPASTNYQHQLLVKTVHELLPTLCPKPTLAHVERKQNEACDNGADAASNDDEPQQPMHS